MSLKTDEYKALKLKFSENDDEKDAHYIYLKKYRSEKKSSNKPVGKTLIVLNIPPYASKDSLQRVFSVVGDVENIIVFDDYKNERKSKYEIPSKFFNDPVPFNFNIGLIVFKKSNSLDAVFSINDLPPLTSEDSKTLTGIEKWIADHNNKIVNMEDMQLEIEEYMKHYDKIKETEENINDGEDDDDDGWIQVGKKGHYTGFKQNEVVIHKLEQKLESQRKKAKKNLHQLTGLYAFESRESKKKDLIELKKKFEEDKSKLQAMRQNRKFRPY